MATLESRIAGLEQQQPRRKKLYMHLIGTYTDQDLLDFLDLSAGATDLQLEAISKSQEVHHGNN